MPQGTDGARDKLAVLRFPVPCRAKPVAGSFCPLCAAAAAHLLFRKRSKNIGLRAGNAADDTDRMLGEISLAADFEELQRHKKRSERRAERKPARDDLER